MAKRTPEERRDYLAQALALDPAEEAGALLAVRRAHLGQAPQERDVAAERAALEARLAELRQGFWESDPLQLSRALGELDVEPFPDLQRAARRLERVAAVHHEVLAAGQLKGMDPHFHEALLQLLIAPEVERAERKRRALEALHEPKIRRAAARSVRALAAAHPEVIQLEGAWFAKVRGSRRWLREGKPGRTALGCFGAYLIVRLVIFLVREVMEATGG